MKIVVTKEHIERAIAGYDRATGLIGEGISRLCPLALALKDAALISGDFEVGEQVVCTSGARFPFSPSLSHYDLFLSKTWQAALENAPFEFEISPEPDPK